MTRPVGIVAAAAALLSVLACAPAPTAPDAPQPSTGRPKPTMSSPGPTSETGPPAPPPTTATPTAAATGTESGIIREILVVTAVVRRYLTAVTVRNEAEAAKFTCGKADGGLLWVSSVGKPIALLRITDINLEGMPTPSARAVIQVDGKPESPLQLEKRTGEWCVWP